MINNCQNQWFYLGIYIPELFLVWGYAKIFVDTYPQILENCGLRMLRFVSEKGYFWFVEPQELENFRLRRA